MVHETEHMLVLCAQVCLATNTNPNSAPLNRMIVQGKTCDDKHKTCLAMCAYVCVCSCLPVVSTEGHLRRDTGEELCCQGSGLSFLCVEAQRQSKHELQDCGDVHGDWLLCGLCEWMDPGLLHHAHGDLDLV